MRRRYSKFNGQKFRFQGDLELAHTLFDFVLAHGDEALQALKDLEQDPEQAALLQELIDQGLLEKFRGRWRLTPRAITAMQRRALMEVFAHMRKGTREGHASPDEGGSGERVEGVRPYQFGDSVSELDHSATLRNAIQREAADRAEHDGLLPLRLSERDFAVHNTESRTSCSTVVLIDRSGSMNRFHRFFHAKKCAMALHALIRQKFPFDTVDLIGFYSGAQPIAEEKLPVLMPQPVTMFDPVIRMQVPLNKLEEQAPKHFTNLHLGLIQARRLLARRPGDNKMVFIITDGQPTAHVQGDYAYLIYPPGKASHVATLKEALLLAKRGIRVCTFALTDDYWDMDWLGFVDDLGRVTRGVTFHCASGDLSSCVMESYLSGRKRKAYLA